MVFDQQEDKAVVKYNFRSGEVAVARRSDGMIKTYYRPNDQAYIMRKFKQGLWAESLALHLILPDQPVNEFDYDHTHIRKSPSKKYCWRQSPKS